MSVSYTKVAGTNLHGDVVNLSSDSEADGLINGRTPSAVKIETYIPPKKRTLLFDIGVLFVLLLLFLVVIGVVWVYVVVPKYYKISDNKTTESQTEPTGTTGPSGWMNTYTNIGSESVMRLMDINDDGADDAIFGVAQPQDLATFVQQPQYCRQYAQGCLGVVMAVDGKTGESLWNMSTYNEIFELNCGNIDINKDKKMDCLGAGRKGSFVAFDPRNGSLLWEPQTGGERYIEYAWNIYNPLVISDTNDDGVPEVFLPHGGDPEFPAENTTRNPGRLLLMDGSSGQLIGNYIDMPDGKETYNSPVLHTDKQGDRYMLIGTGGESVPGSLYVIKTSHLIRQVLATAESQQYKHPESFKGLNNFKNGFYTLFSAKKKGVMVPVVLADVNKDDCHDIIVSSFDGFLAAYDGDTFKQIWKFEEQKAESYTTPGIGYFDDDSYVDFMMHWNYGLWPDYDKSVIIVHSGKNGRPLWTFNTSRFSMTSDLVINTDRTYQDMFVFRIQGRHGTPLDSGIGVVHGIDPQRDLTRNQSLPPDTVTVSSAGGSGLHCDHKDYDILASEVFIVDWQTRHNPRRVFRRDMDKFYYDPIEEEKKNKNRQYEHKTDIFHPNKPTKRCAIMEQSSRTTGAIGDTNGDGKLDLVITFNAQGMINNIDGHYLTERVTTDVAMIEIEKNFLNYPILKADHDLEKDSHHDKHTLNWKPKYQQKWVGYMGADSLSKYENKNENETSIHDNRQEIMKLINE